MGSSGAIEAGSELAHAKRAKCDAAELKGCSPDLEAVSNRRLALVTRAKRSRYNLKIVAGKSSFWTDTTIESRENAATSRPDARSR
jgi:hypothetical protein